jgi:hypothetical protein
MKRSKAPAAAHRAIPPVPLPGDLVICTKPARETRCYTVAIWPHLQHTSMTYQTYEHALFRAREHARAKAVTVWRNCSLDPQHPVLEHVSADGSIG